ncbi:MAG TPA: SRPBCC family protein [Methyloceanibacter sp.]|nr:SRPBCC family protein [Methyloceanibacter sp.]
MAPMMRLILGLGVLGLILAAVALGLPAHVTVARSVVINAPEYAIYPYLNNLRRFPDWSPWVARDPNMKLTYSGPPEGKGAKLEWVSEKPSIGQGSMVIVETEQSRNVSLAANYNGLEGMSTYDLAPSGAGSKVTWTFGYETGSSPMKRWKGLMLDGFIGAEYHAGLEKLKAKIEGDRRSTARPTIVVPQAPVAPVAPQGEQPAAGAAGQSVVKETPAPGAAPAQTDAPARP